MATSTNRAKRTTPKQRVLRKWPSAFLQRDDYLGYHVLARLKGRVFSVSAGLTAREAWARASKGITLIRKMGGRHGN